MDNNSLIFISYAFSNELNKESTGKEFLQQYISRIAQILTSKGVKVWHSLLPDEDTIISGLEYDDAITYCKNKMEELNKENQIILLSILKYPGENTQESNRAAKPSSGMQKEFDHAISLSIPHIVAIQAGLQDKDHVKPYLDNNIPKYGPHIIFNNLEHLFEKIEALSFD